MSCALTADAVRARTKTVTRRSPDTWLHLQPGDRLTLVERSRGLAAGAKQVVLAEVEVTSVGLEDLESITDDDVAREGYPQWDADGFIRFYRVSFGIPDGVPVRVRRIEWAYID